MEFPAIEIDWQAPGTIVAIVALAVVLMFCWVFWLSMRQFARSREYSHRERMKALESGQPVEPAQAEAGPDRYSHNAFWIAFWLGAGVPSAAVSAASSVMVQANLTDFGIVLVIWICAAIISVAGVICATVLLVSSRGSGRKPFSP